MKALSVWCCVGLDPVGGGSPGGFRVSEGHKSRGELSSCGSRAVRSEVAEMPDAHRNRDQSMSAKRTSIPVSLTPSSRSNICIQ